MTHAPSAVGSGFHEGELAVQRRAGVTAQAARLEGMLAPAVLGQGINRFLASRTFAALTARDEAGTLWISPLSGGPGFLQAVSPTVLAVHASPAPQDPLGGVQPDQQAALLVIDFATRRRLRINGVLTHADGATLRMNVEQAYGNCPNYIQQRHLEPAEPTGLLPVPVRRGGTLTPDDRELIRRSDTFLIGTTHPARGKDASHRGGPPGFVRVEDDHLWWPDYQGNNMFNTAGNIAVDPETALLFFDFATGDTVQLSGSATTEFTAVGAPGDDDRTGRRMHFTPRHLMAGRLLARQADTVVVYPHNPPLADSEDTRRV
ncbi:pyridoxamine 5'-phosphate oxidase family protein [Streptomyces sp. NPDC003832]